MKIDTARFKRDMAELQHLIKQMDLGEQQGELGEQQGKLGEKQRALAEQRRQVVEALRRQLQPIIEQAIREGKGKQLAE